MNATKILAVILFVAGALALAYGGFSYTKDKHEADIGPVHMAVKEKEHVSVPLWAGVGLMVVGGVLFVTGSKR